MTMGSTLIDNADINIKTYGGKLYQVELAPEADEYLLWDKPLSEQSEKVKAALQLDERDKLIKIMNQRIDARSERIKDGENTDALDRQIELLKEDIDSSYIPLNETGEGHYKYLSNRHGDKKAASEYLHSLGIRGIKYLDGDSRNDGEGSYNYVIFDDNDISITAKFSQSATSARNPFTLSTLATAIDNTMGNGFTKLLEATNKFKLITSDEVGKYLGDGAKFSVASRTVSPSDYPATLMHSVKHTNTLRNHPDFKAAKEGGDVIAAERIVDDVYKQSAVNELMAKIDTTKPIYIVPVHQREGASMNMIPLAYAHKLASDIGAEIWTDVIKVSGKHNTDATMDERAHNVQEFAGSTPPAGSQVIILDDTFTSGDTLTALTDYLSINGIMPVASTTLANGRYQSELVATEEQRAKLLTKAVMTEVQFEHEFGYSTNHLTGSEVRAYLFNGKAGRTGIANRFPAKRSEAGIRSNGSKKQEQEDGSNPDIHYSKDGRILAFVIGGQTYLVADNISSTDDNIKGLLHHEIGLHALQLGRTESEFQQILKQFEVMRKAGNAKAQAASAILYVDVAETLRRPQAIFQLPSNR